MNLITLLGILWITWAILHYGILPALEDRWVASDMRKKVLRAGSLAMAEKLRDLAATGVLALAVIVALVWCSERLAGTSLNAPKLMIESTGALYTLVKQIADGYGTVLSLVGVVGALWVLWKTARHARRRLVQTWSEEAARIYDHLREHPEEIPALRADTSLWPFLDKIDELAAQLGVLSAEEKREARKEQSAPPDSARAAGDTSSAAAGLSEEAQAERACSKEALFEQLSHCLYELSVEKAAKDLDTEHALATASPEQSERTGVWHRVLRSISSKRFSEDLGIVKKPLSYLATALLYVSLIGWAAEPLANSLQLVVNNLRVNLVAHDSRQDLDAALSQATPTADDAVLRLAQTPSTVQYASRLLARAAIREVIASSVLDDIAGVERNRTSRNEFVRAAIDDQTYHASSVSDVSDDANKVRQEVAHHVGDPGSPVPPPSVERDIASTLEPSLQKLQQENPGRLARIVAQLEARYAAPMSPLDAQGKVVSEIIDRAFGAVDAQSSSELGKQSEKLVKEFGKKAVREWVESFARQYVTNAIMTTARPDVWAHSTGGIHFEASHDAHDFVAAMNAAQGQGWDTSAGSQEQHMYQKVAAEMAKDAPDRRAQQAVFDSMGGYDHLFPARDDTPPNAFDGPERGPSAGGGGGGGGSGGERVRGGTAHAPSGGRAAPSRGFAQARAMSFRMSSLSFRVRGVIIGQDTPSAGIDITDLRWSVQSATRTSATTVRLDARFGTEWHALGTYDAGIVNQALRYAADRRVVATTITPGDGRHVARLTYLHPALVDTPLGCRVVEADRIIDTFTVSEDPLPALAAVTEDREEVGNWMTVVQLAQYAQAPHEDSTCPRNELQELADKRHLHPSHFSPAFAAALKRFIDARDGDSTGSTRLLSQASACASGATARLGDCLCDQYAQGLPARYWFPEDHTSQLRERSESQGPDMKWMSLSQDGLAHFDWWLHVTFALRDGTSGEPDESTVSALDFPADELNQLGSGVRQNLPAYVRNNLKSPSYGAFITPLEEFVVLQRFARSGLSGGLGANFPTSRLIDLAHDTRRYVPVQPTIRWEPYGDPQEFVSVLARADDNAPRLFTNWANDQRSRQREKRPVCDAGSL